MSEFRLEEWEIGSRCREAPRGWADGEVMGKTYRAVEIKRKKWVVFVRESRGQPSGNWMIASLTGNEPRVWANKPEFTRDASWTYGVGRFFTWEREMAFLLANGEGVWLNAQFEAATPFSVAVPSDMVERSSCETFAYLTHTLNEESDFAFAKRWKTLDVEERLTILYGGKELLENVRLLMCAVVWLDPTLWIKDNEWAWRIRIHDEWYGRLYHRGQQIMRGESDFCINRAFLIHQWMVVQTSIPINEHVCIAQFAQTDENYIEVKVNALTTMHERLEARLFLRDWLELNAPERMDLLP